MKYSLDIHFASEWVWGGDRASFFVESGIAQLHLKPPLTRLGVTNFGALVPGSKIR
jgi:hypothetical protein